MAREFCRDGPGWINRVVEKHISKWYRFKSYPPVFKLRGFMLQELVKSKSVAALSYFARPSLSQIFSLGFGLVGTPVVYAEVAPQGLISTSTQGIYSQADGVWLGKSFKSYDKGRLQKLEGVVNQSVGVTNDFQMDWSISYGQAKVVKDKVLSQKKGASRSGIQEAAFHVTRSLLATGELGVNGFAGFRASGNDASGGEFLSLNDNATKYDVGLSVSYPISDALGLGIKYQHSRRPSKFQPPTNLLDFSVSYASNWGTVAAYGAWFSSIKGLDLGSAAFSERAKKTGESPFSELKERHQSVGISYQTSITETLGVSIFYSKKLSGENTDRSQGAGLGVTHYCWANEK